MAWASVLVQPEMEIWRLPLDEDSAPSGRGFLRHEGLSSDARFRLWMPAREETPPALLASAR